MAIAVSSGMLLKHPVRWAAIRVMQNHLLHARKPDTFFPNKTFKNKSSLISILSSSTGNAEHLEEAKEYYLHLCAHQNLLLTYLEEGDPTKVCVVNSALGIIADHIWPDKKKSDWIIGAENADLLNLIISQTHLSIVHILCLTRRKYGEIDINENITVSYEPETTIMKIEEYNIAHKLSDFCGEGLNKKSSKT